MGGIKHDDDKPRMALLSTYALTETSKVLNYGADKYGADNWRKGIAWRRLTGAALRHVLAFNDGEDNDPETGLSHLAHAMCMVMFALESTQTHRELDDRYKGEFYRKFRAAVDAAVPARADDNEWIWDVREKVVVGTRVRVSNTFHYGPLINAEGVIRKVPDDYPRYVVEFDCPFALGHTCSKRTRDKHGYYFDTIPGTTDEVTVEAWLDGAWVEA